MQDYQWQQRKKRSDNIWLAIIIAAYIFAWPIGLVLTYLSLNNKLPIIGANTPVSSSTRSTASRPSLRSSRTTSDADLLRQQKQRAQENAEHLRQQAQRAAETARQTAQTTYSSWESSPAAQRARAEREKRTREAQQKARNKRLKFGGAMFGTGLTLGIIGLLALIGSFSMDLAPAPLFTAIGMAVSGTFLSVSGLLRMACSRRLRTYAGIIRENAPYISIRELAEITGNSEKRVTADLQVMVERGYFEQAWVDKKRGLLVLQPDRVPPEPAPAPAADTPKTEAEQVIARIRTANDLIDDEAVSAKIDRIELLTSKIFDYLRQHPERESELRTFMDYYLPQTLKTLESYARLEAQGVETENIHKAKSKISDMLDQLADSYERQLDRLFDSDVLDISADIEVMKRMLQKDGLTEEADAFINLKR